MEQISGINYLYKQAEIREKLLRIMKLSFQDLYIIARDIGISRPTLHKFTNGIDTTFKCLSRIEMYCIKKEAILKQEELLEKKKIKPKE
jgi:hypothetical protein